MDQQTRRQEKASFWVHALGLVVSVIGTVVLIYFAWSNGTVWHQVGVSVFGGTLIFLYLSSILYHSRQGSSAKNLWRLLDHVAIFLLIAGTYTPLTLVTLRGAWGWSLFGLEWGIALTGVLLKIFNQHRYSPVYLWIYLLMGWLAAAAMIPLFRQLPNWGLIWLFAGGFFYSFGTIYFRQEDKGLNHAVWHGFVLLGSICHFNLVLFFILPPSP